MTIEIEPGVPDEYPALAEAAEELHGVLADIYGPEDVMVEVDWRGAVTTDISAFAGRESPDEWALDGDE